MKPRALFFLVLAAAVAFASLPTTTSASAGGRAGGPSTNGTAIACRRDTAADLRWVSWIHRVHSGVDPTLPEAAQWLGQLADGQPYRDVARSVARAAAPTSATIAGLYRSYLHREPGGSEVDGWTASLRAHGSATVVAELLASDEMFHRAGGTDAGWLDHVYELVLGRSPDAGGRAYWLGRLTGGEGRERVAAALWATPQSLWRRVDASYRKVLGRPGDPGGITHWSTVAAAEGDAALDAALASTQAGWDRAQATYGAPASVMPAPCRPVPRWVPPVGAVVRTLPRMDGHGPLLATLTFDDGPHPTWTPKILEILDRYDIPATFFVVGNWAQRHPDLVRRTLAEGHHLAVHTVSHPNLLTLGAAGQRREIAGSLDIVNGIVGAGHVKCFRPPYGNHDATTDQIAADLGLATIMWSRDGRDWASPGVDHIVQANLDTRYDDGRAVLLLHDGGVERSQTVAALPRLIDSLKARGYEFVQIC
ncbi:MAG: polysaccharide deacetylase family protein [Acidimicrobiales bacterium]|nr:polysaccharide deacetylase family protein [Acidimicrobiales bacterium]